MEKWLRVFLTSSLDLDEWSASCYSRYIIVTIVPSTHWLRGFVRTRVDLIAMPLLGIKLLCPAYLLHLVSYYNS
jgi:hypothetical protein